MKMVHFIEQTRQTFYKNTKFRVKNMNFYGPQKQWNTKIKTKGNRRGMELKEKF